MQILSSNYCKEKFNTSCYHLQKMNFTRQSLVPTFELTELLGKTTKYYKYYYAIYMVYLSIMFYMQRTIREATHKHRSCYYKSGALSHHKPPSFQS